MSLRRLLLACLLLPSLHAAQGATMACPDLAAAVQVGTCPTEEELQYTYVGYCSDNARMYAKDNDECANYQAYRRLKNLVLWESANGDFSGYVSCDLPLEKLRAARAQAVRVARQGSITRLVCSYGEGLSFTHRTRTTCTPPAEATCTGAACQADCR